MRDPSGLRPAAPSFALLRSERTVGRSEERRGFGSTITAVVSGHLIEQHTFDRRSPYSLWAKVSRSIAWLHIRETVGQVECLSVSTLGQLKHPAITARWGCDSRGQQ